MTQQLIPLRDAWLSAENTRTEAYRAFMDATKNTPLRKALDGADIAEKRARAAYAAALQTNQQEEMNDGIDTRTETVHGS